MHLIWGTLNRERVLNRKAAAELSRYLDKYASEQGVYMKINFANADHVHALIDLPTGFSVEKVV
jgi:REP element-mobilizing transposase RayT